MFTLSQKTRSKLTISHSTTLKCYRTINVRNSTPKSTLFTCAFSMYLQTFPIGLMYLQTFPIGLLASTRLRPNSQCFRRIRRTKGSTCSQSNLYYSWTRSIGWLRRRLTLTLKWLSIHVCWRRWNQFKSRIWSLRLSQGMCQYSKFSQRSLAQSNLVILSHTRWLVIIISIPWP